MNEVLVDLSVDPDTEECVARFTLTGASVTVTMVGNKEGVLNAQYLVDNLTPLMDQVMGVK